MSILRARLTLLCLGACVVLGGYLGRHPIVTGVVPGEAFDDTDLYLLLVEETRAGRDYYEALGPALAQHGYGVWPIFHWRLPTLNYAMAALRYPAAGRFVLFSLGVGAIFVWAGRMRPAVGRKAMYLLTVLLTVPAGLAMIRNWYLQHELATGILIALSLGLHGRRTVLCVAFGLTALFVRELALLYVVVMLALAIRERRRHEAIAWALGIVGFALYLAWHAYMVTTHMVDGPADSSWVRFAGWAQVVACSSWMFFALVPYWLVGGVAVLSVVGATASRNPRLALTVGGYMLAVAIVGKPFDDYWGLLFSPLLAVGLVYCIPLLRTLITAARPIKSPVPVTEGQKDSCAPRLFL